MTPILRRSAGVAVLVLLGGIVASACEVAPPERVITYRIATRGAVNADMGEFAMHVAATLSDPRGWSAGGAIRFEQVPGPADFTILLAQASTLPSFGPPCSSQWSCKSGSNVIINQDRWMGATATWPYDLNSYRHYVVNHEVGHWMGLGHASCGGGPGTRAAVMVQQSKGGAAMGACRFNVWPNGDEIAAASRNRGATPRYSGVPNQDDPFGSLDGVHVERDADGRPISVRLTGWAADGDSRDPLGVAVLVDGRLVDFALADHERPDLATVLPFLGTRHGYDHTIALDPSSQVVCVSAGGVSAGYPFVQLGCGVVK
ncbi:MAG: DUF3152 domain-containing protein [Microthrixaceae bacterium]